MIIDLICPMFGKSCRHISMETTTRPYTKIEKDTRTGLFKPSGLGNTLVELGAFCNDAGKFIEQMHYCPVKYANSNHKKYKLPHPSFIVQSVRHTNALPSLAGMVHAGVGGVQLP